MGLVRSAVCSAWGPHCGPQAFLYSIFTGLSLPCLLATAISYSNYLTLGISELKWTGMGEFNSGDHYLYYCGQGSHSRNRVALTAKKKSPKCSTRVQSQKQQNDLDLVPGQTMQYHSNPSQCPNNWCWRSWSWPVLWRPTRPHTHTKDVLFILGDWDEKVGL